MIRGLIQNRLRIILEGRHASHTPINPRTPTDNYETSLADLNRTIADIAKAKETYNSLTPEQKQMLGDVYTGDGLYELVLHKNGQLVGKQNRIGSKGEPGTYSDPNPNKRYFYVMVNRGITHPEYDEESRSGYTVGKSPMTDAALKVKIFMGDDMIDYLRSNIGYIDGKGEDIRNQKMSPDQIDKLKRKEDLYQKRMSSEKSFGDKETELRSKLYDLTIARRNAMLSKDRETVSKIKKIESQIKSELEQIVREKNKLRSSE